VITFYDTRRYGYTTAVAYDIGAKRETATTKGRPTDRTMSAPPIPTKPAKRDISRRPGMKPSAAKPRERDGENYHGRIMAIVREKPGLTARQIGDLIDVPEEQVRVYMVKAENNGHATSKRLPKPDPKKPGPRPRGWYVGECVPKEASDGGGSCPQVLEAIRTAPGMTVAEISERIGVSYREVRYHLGHLRKTEKVFSQKRQGKRKTGGAPSMEWYVRDES
jgi:hypothetical protein